MEVSKMSEKQQHTAARMRDKMKNKYSDDNHHKHDKLHLSYRMHCRSHPVEIKIPAGSNQELSINSSTGLVHLLKLRKVRKRLARGSFH
jgi:hypothetical protein